MTSAIEGKVLISVVIPTFNRAHLISETIESVLAQSYSNWELIIVDDGSTDDTQSLIRNFSDPRIRYSRIEHTGSFGAVRNLGIQASRGEFIAFLDSDDIWDPMKLEKQLHAISNSNCKFCFTQIQQFGKSAVQVPSYKSLKGRLLEHYLEEGHFAYYPSSLMFDRKVLVQIGLLDKKNLYGADPEFFVSLCHHFHGAFLSEALVRIRKHEKNTSSRDPLFSYPEMITLLKKAYRNGYIKKRLFDLAISKLYYKMGLIQKHQGKITSSLKYFLSFSYYRPLNWKGWVRIISVVLKFFYPKTSQRSLSK